MAIRRHFSAFNEWLGAADPNGLEEKRVLFFSLEDAPGHAKINRNTGDITVYLPTLTPYLGVSRGEFPLNTVEDMIEDIIVHELLHEATDYEKGLRLDTWHMLLCRIENSHLPEATKCNCPIDCYFRDCMNDDVHVPTPRAPVK